MFITILLKAPPILKGISSTDDIWFFCRLAASFNKNIMVGILLAEKALLKSPYVKRYLFKFTNIGGFSDKP
jgi:hypothetical protein